MRNPFKCPVCKGTKETKIWYSEESAIAQDDNYTVDDCFDCEAKGTLLGWVLKQWDSRWKYRVAKKWGKLVCFLTGSYNTIIVWKKSADGKPDISKHEDVRRYSMNKQFLNIIDEYGHKKVININTPDLLHIFFQNN